ncbi:MAG: hypothetical protein AAF333_02660 [Planctomycetota bacterium]
MYEHDQKREPVDSGLQAWAGIAGAGMVLALGLAALWAAGGGEPLTSLAAAPTMDAVSAAEGPAAVALYDDEGGAHQTPPTPGTEQAAASLFGSR